MTPKSRLPRLSDPQQVEDHLRQLVDRRRYGQHSLLVVCCDARAEPTHHIEVVDCDPAPATSECVVVLDNLLATIASVAEQSPSVGLLLAVTRPGGEQVTSHDRVWFRALYRICHLRGLTPLGLYIVGSHGVRPVHVDDAA